MVLIKIINHPSTRISLLKKKALFRLIKADTQKQPKPGKGLELGQRL